MMMMVMMMMMMMDDFSPAGVVYRGRSCYKYKFPPF